jgi:hypothetical protein
LRTSASPGNTAAATSAGSSAAAHHFAFVVAMIVAGSANLAIAQPSPAGKLLGFLWNYQNESLRPYVAGVQLSGGHSTLVGGRPRLTGATANVRSSLHDEPSFAKAARAICQAARSGVENLHLAMVSAVRVWSAEGHTVARCLAPPSRPD